MRIKVLEHFQVDRNSISLGEVNLSVVRGI